MCQAVDVSESSVSIVLQDATISEAKSLSIELADPVGVEVIPAADAHRRIIAKDLAATTDFPRFANSAMDGWAVRSADAQRSYKLIGESRAGQPFADSVVAGTAVRISTGAALPAGADAIVPLERGSELEGQLLTEVDAESGAFVRAAGRHVRAGDALVSAGRVLGAGELASIAAFGIRELAVRARPRVALVAGGNEILTPGDPLVSGAIYDSNSPMLRALLSGAGADVAANFYDSDDREGVRVLLAAAADESDLIVTSGGISVGAHDHIGGAIEDLGGELLLSGTAARPGRRFAIAQLPVGSRRVTVFCLPGNPISSWVCFQLYVRRHLRAMLGQEQPRVFEAALSEASPRQQKFSRVLLGRTSTNLGARSFTPRPSESDDVTAIASCNALATIGTGESVAHKGLFAECERVDG